MTWLRRLLMVWGVVSLVGALAGGLWFAQTLHLLWNREAVDALSVREARAALESCNLGGDRLEAIVHSYVSARSPTGDYLDAYALRVTELDSAQLALKPPNVWVEWRPGDQLPPILDAAVRFAGGFLDDRHLSWFPREAELRSADVRVYPVSVAFRGDGPTSAVLIFAVPKERMVFYLAAKI
ncbi:MAG TPA: hypothetical protein VMR50_11115 [Myxococcota bacterium]|nr:hypothetical protein [Myxococcota bacterium]